ncbi:hypothetical protein J5N97_018955 [Dioscorea zingiberensis]|uniref:Protein DETOXIFICATION n=1 Tax=Dioscorea zingiberensis TaxID=325984 RepID=A0A9D5HBY5_9LILI|nr:hypothetical protein J5N97_018955 [Dioscorea zingiberensis]
MPPRIILLKEQRSLTEFTTSLLINQAMSSKVDEECAPRDIAAPPSPPSSSSSSFFSKWAMDMKHIIFFELRQQRGIALPLIVMNLAWFLKTAITTAYLGRLGELQLAGGTLGFTFANVTGFSVLTGLSYAVEPICGQAYGARNYNLLHKTLFMAILMLLLASIPISFLWLCLDKILLFFGQQEDITNLAKKYVIYLLPDLVVTSFLCPLKAYLSSQGITLPTLFSSAVGLALHIPLNILLSNAMGLIGVAMAVWLSDLTVAISLALYVFIREGNKGGGWLEQSVSEWLRMIKLSASCCLTTCLEWWCYEILVLIAGRLPDPRRALAVLAVVLNFDYLVFSVMLSLATCASTRVSNELGAGRAMAARSSAYVSLGISVISGFLGGSVMLAVRGEWGLLFSHDKLVISAVKRMMMLMGGIELVNFPLTVCGGIARGTARPWMGMYASLGGFYLVALPLSLLFSFRVGMGLAGLLLGFLFGGATSLLLLLVFIALIDWADESEKAHKLANSVEIQAGSI